MSENTRPSSSSEEKQIVQELSWKMLDGCLDEEEAEQLDLHLNNSEAARLAYIEVVQLHVTLLDKFGGLPSSGDLIKNLLDKKLAEPPTQPEPTTSEVPTSEPTGA